MPLSLHDSSASSSDFRWHPPASWDTCWCAHPAVIVRETLDGTVRSTYCSPIFSYGGANNITKPRPH